MKSVVVCLTLLLMSMGVAHAQSNDYRVVFDLTSRDSLDQKAVLRMINEILATSPDAELEVVMYGKGPEIAVPEKSPFATDVKKALTHPNVSFKVCAIAMKNNKIEKAQLTEGVQIVPDGVYEIVSKQHEGWGYIKVGH